MIETSPVPLVDTNHALMELSERRLDHLWIAAKKWMTNLAWLNRRKAKLVALLDYDLICGAIPRLQMKALSQYAEESSTDLFAPTGRAYLNLVLERDVLYSIPPGSLAELDHKQAGLESNVGRSLHWFESLLNEARRSRDPLVYLKRKLEGRSDSITEIIFGGFGQLETESGDLALIKSLRNGSTPWEKLVSTEEGGDVKRVFDDAAQHLDLKRPQKQTNNRNDAYNIALAFKLASTLAPARENRFFPMLVSRTHAVVNYTDSLRKFIEGSEQDEPPHVISDPSTFRMGCALLAYAENRSAVARDYAIQLGREAGDLKAYLSRMLDRASVANPVQGQLEVAARMEYEFRRRWEPLLKSEYRVVHKDCNDVLDTIDATLRREAGRLDSHNNSLVREALNKLDIAVRTAQRIHESGVQSAMSRLRIERPTLALVSDVVNLSAILSGDQHDEICGEGKDSCAAYKSPREHALAEEEVAGIHHWRMEATHLIAGPSLKVTADTWQSEAQGERHVSFTRTYHSDVSALFDDAARLFSEQAEGDAKPIEAIMFSPECYYTAKFVATAIKNMIHDVDDLRRKNPAIDYGEIRMDSICFCVEISDPTESTEAECVTSVTMVFPASRNIAPEGLARWLNAGSENPASIKMLVDLLNPLHSYLKLTNPPPR